MVHPRQSLVAAHRRIQELERELAALRSTIGKPDCDVASIGKLLCEDILRLMLVRSWREPHPFGSTVARETLAEAQLPSAVTIDAEDVETLPRRVRLSVAKGGADFRVTARLRADDGSLVVYAIEDE
jgi:hypothetical protein